MRTAGSRFSEVSANLSWPYLLPNFGGDALAKENLEMPQTNLPLGHTLRQAHQSTPENKAFPYLVSQRHVCMLPALFSPGVGVPDIGNFFLKQCLAWLLWVTVSPAISPCTHFNPIPHTYPILWGRKEFSKWLHSWAPHHSPRWPSSSCTGAQGTVTEAAGSMGKVLCVSYLGDRGT